MAFLTTLTLCLVLVTAYTACGNEVITIPLDEIWAAQMPGTRKVRTLDPKRFDPLKSLVRPIEQSLNPKWKVKSGEPQRPIAGAGFAVMGSGRIALEHAHAVLVKKKPPQQSFPAGSEISAIFFSYDSGVYVHLHRVEMRGDVIKIWYRLVPHFTRDASVHFALVPLGKLSTGKRQVEIIQSPLDREFADQRRVKPLRPKLGRQIVCKSFSIFVVDKKSD